MAVNPRLIPANTTLLQPGTRYFRISDALAGQAQALNTSNQLITLQAQVTAQGGYITALQGQVATLQSQMATANANISTLQGQVTALQQFMRSFDYQQIEIATGNIYLDQRNIYRRSFVVPGAVLGTANQVGQYVHGVAAINYIITIQAIAGLPGGQFLPITFLQTAQAPMVNGLSVWADAANMYFSVGNTPFGTYTLIATMWYTATNR